MSFSPPLAGAQRQQAVWFSAVIDGVDPVLVVYFLAAQWRVEYAGHFHVLGTATQHVLVVLVQDVQRAGTDLIYLTVRQGFDLTVPAHAVDRLQVVLVMDVGLFIGVDGGDVEGKPHLVVLEQHPGAFPGLGGDTALGVFTVLQCTYDHGFGFLTKLGWLPALP